MNCYKCATPIPDNARFCSTCGADVSGEHLHDGERTVAMEETSELQRQLQAELGTEYLLEKELGRGGMAVVFLGRDAHLNRKVAVKVLPPELTFGGKGSMIERFKREAQTAAKLDHPNIIPVYRVAPGGKLFWYVMKYLDGEPLDDILEREGQLAVERTVQIVVQVADALDYAHQSQVVHRDVKPANVVVDTKGRVTVTDFGIAKALDANTLTASGSIIGTPYYMSPEQCKGKRVGPAADQYSLAVMTYQMLGGHLPFTGDSAVEIVHKHVADPVPPLGVLRPQLPEKVIQVVERGLAKTPEERFATVADFAKALKAASEGLDYTAAPPVKPAGVRMSKTALVSPVPGALRTARDTWRERKGPVLGGLGAVVVVVAVGVALLSRGGPRTPESQRETPSQQPGALPPSGTQLAAAESASTTGPAAPRPTAAEPTAAPPASAPPQRRQATAAPATKPSPQQRPAPARFGAAEQQLATAPPQHELPPAVPAKQEPAPAPAAALPTPAPAAPAAAVGYLSLGTQPVSTIYVNGVAKGARLANLEVPAGTVRLRFQVQDSSGIWWAQDREVTVAAGERKVLGYIRLVRP